MIADQQPPAAKPRSRTRLAIQAVLSLVLVWMTAAPGLGFWRAMVMTQSTTAVTNTVPGGSAIGIGMTYSMFG